MWDRPWYLRSEAELEEQCSIWHNTSDEPCELHEFLGMTWEEYVEWCRNPAHAKQLSKAVASILDAAAQKKDQAAFQRQAPKGTWS